MKKKIIFLVAIFLLNPFLFLNLQASEIERNEKGSIRYLFSEHLSEAKAKSINPESQTFVSANWENNSFNFLEMGKTIVIKTTPESIVDIRSPGILLRPVTPVIKRLEFSAVPSGNKMILDFSTEELEDSTQKANIYLRVFAGRHELKFLRITHQKGMQQETIDLGPMLFLNHASVISFEINSDVACDGVLFFQAAVVLS